MGKFRATHVHYFQVFSSETSRWEEVKVRMPIRIELCCSDKLVVYNGILHFVVERDHNVVGIAYDPYTSSGHCCIFGLPHSPNACTMQLGVSRDCLMCAQFECSRDATCCNIWRLKDYNKGDWSFVYKIASEKMTDNITMFKAFHPFDPNVIYFHRRRSLLCFDIRTQDFKNVRIQHDSDEIPPARDGLPFVVPSWPTVVP